MADTTPSVTLDDVCRLLTQVRDLLETFSRPPAELLTRDDMAAKLHVGVSTFDRLKAVGKIGPKPLELGGVKYSAAEVQAWLANRDYRGELHDADSWPAVWATLTRKSSR